MDHQRTVNVRGEMAAPNDFTVTLGPEDHAQFAEIGDSLASSLAGAAREHARDEGYAFMGPVEVHLEVDHELGAGSFGLSARFKEGVGGTGGGALLLSDGSRVTLADTLITLGRSPDCSIHLADSSVSRRHAEIRPAGDGWLLVDTGSTNGTRVNGATVTERRLADGDTVTVGDVKLHFEAS